MNNLEAIDYTINDWVEDNDVCISRRSTEFPRLTDAYQTYFSPEKPWGRFENPQLIDFQEHPIHYMQAIRPGVWYYGGLSGADHLDLCGFPEGFAFFRTLLDIEYRYEQWRLIFIRAKLIKFDKKDLI